MTNVTTKLTQYGLAGILILIPFHAFLTVWLASRIGHYDLLRVWKEAVLVILASIAVGMILAKGSLKKLAADRLIYLSLAYIAILGISGLLALADGRVNGRALTVGLILDIRLIVLLLASYILALHNGWLLDRWKQIIIWPALLVIGFGLLQQFVLPADFLIRAGYGPDTIPSHQTVDQKPEYLRLQSTLRGPNTLGVYLVLVIGALFWLAKDRSRRPVAAILMMAGLLVLFFTYSRSALGAVLVSLGLLIWMGIKQKRWRRHLLLGLLAALLIGAITIFALRNNDVIQNIVFHTDEHSQSPRSTNFDRAAALNNGLNDMTSQPLGGGVGTAGPASAHNDSPARIAENYYLQIGQEAGIAGLLLFIAINLMVGLRLWYRRSHGLAAVLFASFIAITLVNFVSHAWADDTIAYLWWGMAGAALALPAKRKT